MKRAAVQRAIQRHRDRDGGAFFQRFSAHIEKWQRLRRKNKIKKHLEYRQISRY